MQHSCHIQDLTLPRTRWLGGVQVRSVSFVMLPSGTNMEPDAFHSKALCMFVILFLNLAQNCVQRKLYKNIPAPIFICRHKIYESVVPLTLKFICCFFNQLFSFSFFGFNVLSTFYTISIIGRSCHKYHFCHDKRFVATNIILLQHNYKHKTHLLL